MVSWKLIGALFSVALFVGVLFFTFMETPRNTVRVIDNPQENPIGDSGSNIVEVTREGFFPRMITISQGETVVFVNRHTMPSWPATDIHPTHMVYPGSDIKKCHTNGSEEVFDACRGLEEGEEYIFRFDEFGEWKYHDHLNAQNRGIIVVE